MTLSLLTSSAGPWLRDSEGPTETNKPNKFSIANFADKNYSDKQYADALADHFSAISQTFPPLNINELPIGVSRAIKEGV